MFSGQEPEINLTAILACSSGQDENFSLTRRTPCLESWNQTFLAQGAEMSQIAIKLFVSAR